MSGSLPKCSMCGEEYGLDMTHYCAKVRPWLGTPSTPVEDAEMPEWVRLHITRAGDAGYHTTDTLDPTHNVYAATRWLYDALYRERDKRLVEVAELRFAADRALADRERLQAALTAAEGERDEWKALHGKHCGLACCDAIDGGRARL